MGGFSVGTSFAVSDTASSAVASSVGASSCIGTEGLSVVVSYAVVGSAALAVASSVGIVSGTF